MDGTSPRGDSHDDRLREFCCSNPPHAAGRPRGIPIGMESLIGSAPPRPDFSAFGRLGRSRLHQRSKFDHRWECNDTSSPTRSGRASSRSFPLRIIDIRSRANVDSSALCTGLPEHGCPWRDLPRRYGNWKWYLTVSTTGRRGASGSDSSRSCRSKPIPLSYVPPRGPSSMGASSGRTSTPRAEKGDPTQCFGTL
jgi:hypothetical protein